MQRPLAETSSPSRRKASGPPAIRKGMGLKRPIIVWWPVALGLTLIGCGWHQGRLWRPGTIEQQRLRATIHDPYPDPDFGPAIDGGRPREYQRPLPEAVRNRIYVDSWWWR
jgi:hypothetical protein